MNDMKEKGHLKIFLGMAAGVGKTYAMLKAAQKRVDEQVDVLVGIVNTHGRPETAHLLESLKLLPEITIFYKGKEFKELDVDGVIKLKPQLVLIDELAHSNVPGAKHLKRWQDVNEILDAGIDVYTTLNVQHIESYKDIVEGITGIKIRETVPDLMLEQATSITCVDITPQELLQRLREGNVYTGDLSLIALQNFFQEDRLTALREIALRCTAEVVDRELHDLVKAIQKGKGWRPRERLLVAINHNPYSQQLIRTTRRLSFNLHAPWTAVYVDCGESLNEDEALMLSKNLALARELGGEVITTQDTDIAQGIQRIAEQKNITQIIAGKSLRKKFFSRSPIDKLLKISSGIDVHIIRQSELFPRTKPKVKKREIEKTLLPYFHILFWTFCLGVVCTYLVPYVGYHVIGNTFLLSILLLSLFFRRGPLFLSAIFFALIWDFYFVPPVHSFKIAATQDLGFFFLFFLAALITGILSNRVRKRQEMLRKKEQSTQAIYEITHAISSAPTAADLFQSVKEKLGTILQGSCGISIKKENGTLGFEGASDLVDNEKEQAVANWVFEHGQEAGWSTITLPSVRNLYIPLKGFKEVVGVLVFRPSMDKPLLPEENNFLYTVAQQLANFLERRFSEERERKAILTEQKEQMYAKVIKSLSEELTPPLKGIEEVIFHCRGEELVRENVQLFTSLKKIELNFGSLMRIAETATAMAKISGGKITIKKEAHNVEELIGTCVHIQREALKEHQLKVTIVEKIPPVPFDFSLMTILLNHLLTNAIEYSPHHTTIEIGAEAYGGTFVLSVSNEGERDPGEYERTHL